MATMEMMFQAMILAEMKRVEQRLSQAMEASVYLAGAAILTLLIIWAVRRFSRYSSALIQERGGLDQIEVEKQTTTIITLVRRILIAAVWLLAVILALDKFDIDVKPLLAGAGVAGIAIGFAAQSILKDWISGFFLITEGQIRLNDVVRIGALSGGVEKISLRTISLRNFDGSLHVISNGSITSFSNLTMAFSYYVFEVSSDFGQDPDRMMALMRRIDESMRSDGEFASLILEPIEIVGVDRFTEQGVIIKARIKTQPSRQWMVGREFNRRLKLEADEQGVTIATAQRALKLYGRDDGGLLDRRLLHDPEIRNEMKKIVAEALRESPERNDT